MIARALELFLLGLAVSYGPCLAFCAPAILAYIAGTSRSWRSGLSSGVIFSLTRFAVQVVLITAASWLGIILTETLHRRLDTLQLLAGVFVAVVGIIVLLGGSKFKFCPRTSGGGAAFLGFIEGATPCLPFLGVLVYTAFRARTTTEGLVFGLAFGSGALLSPILFLSPLLGGLAGKFSAGNGHNILFKLSGLLLVGFGLFLALA